MRKAYVDLAGYPLMRADIVAFRRSPSHRARRRRRSLQRRRRDRPWPSRMSLGRMRLRARSPSHCTPHRRLLLTACFLALSLQIPGGSILLLLRTPQIPSRACHRDGTLSRQGRDGGSWARLERGTVTAALTRMVLNDAVRAWARLIVGRAWMSSASRITLCRRYPTLPRHSSQCTDPQSPGHRLPRPSALMMKHRVLRNATLCPQGWTTLATLTLRQRSRRRARRYRSPT